MRKRYRELILSSIAQRIRTEIGAPKALNAPLVEALEGLKNLPEGTWPREVPETDAPLALSCGTKPGV